MIALSKFKVLYNSYIMESNQGTIDKLVTGARQGMIGTIGGRFLGVLGSILAARILGPAVFGLYAIGWTLLRFLSLLFPMGMDRAVLRFAPQYWKRDPEGLKGLFYQTIFLSFGSGLIFGILLYLLAPWLATTVYHKPELLSVFRLFSIAFPMLSLLIVVTAATRITQKVKISMLIQDIGQPILGLFLMIGFYFLGLKISGVILSDIISITIAAVVSIVFIFRVFPEIIPTQTKYKNSLQELFAYAVPAALGGAFSVYVFWIDRILIGYLRPSYDNGIYLAVSQISTIFLVISSGINSVVVPIFSSLFHQKDMKTLEEIYRISTKWGIYFSVPILIVLLISPGSTLSLIYGGQYQGGAIVLLVLLAGQAVNLITGSVNPLLIMTGNQKFLFKLSGIVLAVDIILNYLLIKRYGLIGAAVGTSISLSGLYLIALFWVKYKLGLWPYDRRYLKGLWAGLAAILIVGLIKMTNPVTAPWGVILQGIGALAGFFGMLYLQKLDSEDLKFIRNIFNKFNA